LTFFCAGDTTLLYFWLQPYRHHQLSRSDRPRATRLRRSRSR
jgi:hypothetical protein